MALPGGEPPGRKALIQRIDDRRRVSQRPVLGRDQHRDLMRAGARLDLKTLRAGALVVKDKGHAIEPQRGLQLAGEQTRFRSIQGVQGKTPVEAIPAPPSRRHDGRIVYPQASETRRKQ